MLVRRVTSHLVRVLFIGIFTVGLLPDLSAQYFGQNKVRYETLDFKVLQTDHFDIHYYDEEADVAPEVGRMAERWYSRLSTVLGHQLSSQQPIVLYASHPAFRGTAVVSGAIGETTGGVTEGLKRRLVMPVAGPLAETDHVLGHELVHAFQFDITRRSGGPVALQLPLWFIEGMAEYLSLGSVDPLTAMWMRDAVRREDLPTIAELDDPDYFPYRFGQAFWAYIDGTYGSQTIGQILSAATSAGVEDALLEVLGMNAEAISEQWHSALTDQYQPVLEATSAAEDYGMAVVQAQQRGGQLNVAPVLSPDGSQMIFFSERDLFSIDLYLADSRTGEIQRKITETALDPHFDSLQFVNSAGAWSADGNRLALGAISEGRPELTIYDIEGKRVDRRFKFPQFGEILGATWSPDGRFIALSAMSGGVTDLFVLELETENLRRLTDDAFADLQPVWSPDGTQLAFVTDRFTSDLAALSFGEYRLGLVSVATGATSAVRGFTEGKHINPQWTADSANLYFLSDRDGISNIYRVSLAAGDLRQITNVETGVSGISKLSPAFSVTANATALVFSAFSEGTYSIYRVDAPAALAGAPPSQAVALLNAAMLPPVKAGEGEVARLLGSPNDGLPQSQRFTTTDYKPHFSLDYIAPPQVSVGVGNFGSLVGGGTAFSWSDLLGDHNITATVQTTISSDGGNFLNNLSGILAYTNQKSRWSWGVMGGQTPFVSGGFSRAVGDTESGPIVADESIQTWQINRELGGIFGYPFNRAQRLEFSAGYRNISFDAESRTQIYSLETGELLDDRSDDLPMPASLNIGTAAAALVYDTSIFGGTSPILGQRYRFELGGAAGSLRYVSVLADYRRYFQPMRPLTVATRLMHFGRYGRGSGDERLQDFFVGNNSLVRGYNPGSFSADDCEPANQQADACPAFDQLLGSRMAVANAELRLPIFGYLGIVPSAGVPPVETALFYDAGVAWTGAETANFLGGSRRPVTSYGGTVRVNILGFAIGQMSYVHPNDRPAKRWMWEFSLNAGF